jgi:hypothetical protein
MALNSRRRILACAVSLITLSALSPARYVLAQRISPAEGPWSGQAQCVVVAESAEYRDEQTHTWRLTGAAPTPAPRGSAQVYYTWPATWSVQGAGRKSFQSRTTGSAAPERNERWTIANEMNVTLRTTAIVGTPERLRIGVEGQRGAPLGSIRVTEVSGRTRDAAVQPWPFPSIEDNATSTTITGSSTRTYPEGFGVGWSQPPKVITTATCTWTFTRGGVEQSSVNRPAATVASAPTAPTVTAPPRTRASTASTTLSTSTATTTPSTSTSTAPPATVGQQAAASASGSAATSPSPDTSPFAGPNGGTDVALTNRLPSECTADNFKVELLPVVVSPGGVEISWARPAHGNLSFYTFAPNPWGPYAWVDYNIRRDDRSEPIAAFDAHYGLPPQYSDSSPITYIHRTALEPGRTYRYTITSLHSHQNAPAPKVIDGCAFTEVRVTGPNVASPALANLSSSGGNVTISWTIADQRQTGFLVIGTALPSNGRELPGTARTITISGVPASGGTWVISPFWGNVPDRVIDVDRGLSVSTSLPNATSSPNVSTTSPGGNP